MSRVSLWPWLLVLVVIGAGTWALIETLPGPTPKGLVVHVRVVDPKGLPLDVAVRITGAEDARRVDASGWVRLASVPRPRDGRIPSDWLHAAVQIDSRFHAARAREVDQRDDGSWEVRITAVHHGLITLRIKATTLPNAHAYLEADEHVQAVDGIGVARLAQGATYRVFPGGDTVLLTVLGDTGTAMERFRIRAPSPGFVLQHDVRARPARPLSGRVVAPEGVDVPTLTGTLRLVPSKRGTGNDEALPSGVDPYVEIDPVQIQPDGFFIAPHTTARAYTLHAELDFLGPTDPQTVEGGEDVDVVADVRRAWVQIVFRDGLDTDPHDAVYGATPQRAEGADESAWWSKARPRVLHHGERTYVVLSQPGLWVFDVRVPGTQGRAPSRGSAEAEIDDVGPRQVELDVAPAAFGRVLVNVPEAVCGAMRGGTLTISVGGTERSHSLLRNLTREIVMKHVETGQAYVRIDWQDAEMAAWETTVEVPPDGEVAVTAERTPK